jgi:hypothetical protein
MSVQKPVSLNPKTQAMLDCLQQAVADTLERKRRLGQYAVFWSEGAAIAVGEDAPLQLTARKPSQTE